MEDERAIRHRELVGERSFADVVEAVDAALGTLEGDRFAEVVAASADGADFEARIRAAEGTSGFMRFAVFDHGAWMGLLGRPVRARLYVLGNPLVAWTMLRHDLRAALHVPVRVLIYEDEDGRCRGAYDLPSSLMAPLGDARVSAAAEVLDAKLAALVEDAIDGRRATR
jgi:uncharacterized protein (DUF302 family)